MGKGEKIKRKEMFSDYCMQQNCGMYMEWLEQRIAELEFQLGLQNIECLDPISAHEKVKDEYYKEKTNG